MPRSMDAEDLDLLAIGAMMGLARLPSAKASSWARRYAAPLPVSGGKAPAPSPLAPWQLVQAATAGGTPAVMMAWPALALPCGVLALAAAGAAAGALAGCAPTPLAQAAIKSAIELARTVK